MVCFFALALSGFGFLLGVGCYGISRFFIDSLILFGWGLVFFFWLFVFFVCWFVLWVCCVLGFLVVLSRWLVGFVLVVGLGFWFSCLGFLDGA